MRKCEDIHEMDLKVCILRLYGIDSSGLRKVLVASPCEHDNEPSGFFKGGKFRD